MAGEDIIRKINKGTIRTIGRANSYIGDCVIVLVTKGRDIMTQMMEEIINEYKNYCTENKHENSKIKRTMRGLKTDYLWKEIISST